ncbi:MAG TPA: substrate-binding domain-containing protein [Microbacteriaceae bacterium]|nr:substrate-binding domain-containing protein [Microbacteriaceae bacterium]
MHGRTRAALGGAAAFAAVSLALAGCTAGSPSPEATDGETTAAGVTYMDMATGECAVEPNEGVNFADAQAYLDSFKQVGDSLLTDKKLPNPIEPGTLVVYLDNASPYSAQLATAIGEAAAASGAEFQSVNVGSDAQSINSGMNAVVTLDPDVIITFATDLTFWQDQYKTLTDNGTAIVYAGNGNAIEFGLNETYGTPEASVVNGSVIAAAAIVATCGTGTDFVYYPAPEIVASVDMYSAYESYIKDHVPGATVRSVDISIMDTDGASKIVSDLQAHPETDFCSPSSDQWQVGLAEKAKLAGVTNAYCFGGISIPQNYQLIKDGQQVGTIAYDPMIQSWQALDEGYRKLQGVFEDYDMNALIRQTAAAITQQNIDRVDVQTGAFNAVPGFEDMFLKLWNVK